MHIWMTDKIDVRKKTCFAVDLLVFHWDFGSSLLLMWSYKKIIKKTKLNKYLALQINKASFQSNLKATLGEEFGDKVKGGKNFLDKFLNIEVKL